MDTFLLPQPLRCLFLDMNSFFASVEQQENPRLRGRPVIVVPVESQGTCAIAASIEAKRFGIRTGTGVREARERCPDLVMILADHKRYVDYHERIVAEVWRHLPVTKICSIDEMACTLLDNERAPERAIQLARAIKQGIYDNIGPWLKCSIGIAPSRLLAKIGSNLRKPDGLTVIEHADIPARLFPLGLRDLPGIARNRERRLAVMGITSIEQFWNLPPSRARRVWGSIEGEQFWYGLHGIELADRETKRGSIGHSHVLGPHLRPPAMARLVARRLLAKAASRMRRMGYHAKRLGLSVSPDYRCSPLAERWKGSIDLPGARDDTPSLLAALEILWEARGRTQGGAHIKKVGVVLHDLILTTALEPDLFGDTAAIGVRPRHRALCRAIDALNTRFGRDTVSLGPQAFTLHRDIGTKIAFTRVPDQQEFLE